jgi:hypothetical protein
MTPQEFMKSWTENGERVSPIDPERLMSLNLKEQTIEFLILSGLPIEAAPFLTFSKDTDDLYEGVTQLTNQYDFLESEYNKFIAVGYDGGGNPIVINTDNNDQIEWLDHEDNFSSRFMNSSISKLTDYLIIYRDFLNAIFDEHGEDAYAEGKFSEEQFSKLKENMMQADLKAITDGFWKHELENLLANRAEHLNKDKSTAE